MNNNELAKGLMSIAMDLQKLASQVLEKEDVEVEQPITIKSVIPPKAKITKPVSYDNNPDSPSYDPEPPFQLGTLPPRVVNIPEVIMRKGQKIKCMKCGNIIFTINSDIAKDNINTSAIDVESGMDLGDFKFYKGANAPGLSTDCPLCKAGRSVVLFGKVETSNKVNPLSEGTVSV